MQENRSASTLHESRPPRAFFICSFILLAGVLAALALLGTTGTLGKTAPLSGPLYLAGFGLLISTYLLWPKTMGPGWTLVLILVLGFGLRMTFLAFPASYDVFRYVWEGWIQNQGYNPFVYSPDSPELRGLAIALPDIHAGINHKDFSTIYPPLPLLLFRFLAFIDPSPELFKTAMSAMDAVTMTLLAVLILQRDMPPKRLLLYAANPLVLLFIAGEGHLDGIQVFFLVLALIFKQEKMDGNAFLCLGLAGMSKYLAFICLPFFITRQNIRYAWLAFVPLALYLPFIGAGPKLFSSLAAFGSDFHYNDSLAVVLRTLFPQGTTLITGLLLMGWFAFVYLTEQDYLISSFYALAGVLLFMPTLHPWYLVLIMPFLTIRPSIAWLWLAAAMAFTFPVMWIEYRTNVFQELHWVKPFMYVPFYFLLTRGLFRQSTLDPDHLFRPVTRLSVIIPTFNEAALLRRCIASLKNEPRITDIIVSDCGSTDGTAQQAERLGATVVQSPKGRGLQIAAALRMATADAILVLHADCTIRPGLPEEIITTLNANPGSPGGSCGMLFQGDTPKQRLISRLNSLRVRLTAISFGDQGQFFRRQALKMSKGFPRIKLMEDVELALRLKKLGPLMTIPKGITASTRRWNKTSFLKNILTILTLFTQYLFERKTGLLQKEAITYYDKYYRDR